MNPPAPVLVASDLTKRYGGVHALRGLSVEIEAGEIHAILGENGAGKSTLMRILAGAEQPTSGVVSLDQTEVSFRGAKEAEIAGIGIVHQELSLFPERSVLANLMVGSEPSRFGLISKQAMRTQVATVSTRLGLSPHLDTPVGTLPLATQQLVELARVLLKSPRVLILDEPNSALSDAESEVLFEIVRELRAMGTAIVYVSHRLEEVFDLCDRVTVVRSGKRVLTERIADVELGDVVLAMTGSNVGHEFPPLPSVDLIEVEPAIRIRDLHVRRTLKGIDLDVRRSEILGLVGLEGSGVSTLIATLFGSARPKQGKITMHDSGGLPRSPSDAVRRRVSLVPADRKTHGLMLERSLSDNVLHVSRGAMPKQPWFIDRRADRTRTAARLDSLSVRYASVGEPATNLSGGNQQKVVIAKWLEADPEVFLLDDPTRGVDVGGKFEIHQIIAGLAASGKAVILRSSDLDEVIGTTHRIAVFHRGLVARIVQSDQTTKAELLALMNGSDGEVTNTMNGSAHV